MTPTNTEAVSDAKLNEILAGLEGVTPGPWQVIEEKHEWSLPERAMMGHDMPAKSGEHLERRIFTTWDHGQLKSPFPVVNSSIGIGKVGEPSVQMVWMQPEDAAHIARCDPDTIRYLVTQELSRRSTSNTGGVEVKALIAAYLAGASCPDGITQHEALPLAEKYVDSLAAEAEPAALGGECMGCGKDALACECDEDEMVCDVETYLRTHATSSVIAEVTEALERAAAEAYRVCAETRHVTLGDKASDAILALRPSLIGGRENG